MPSSGGGPSRPSGSSPVGSVGSVLVYSWQPVRELTGTDGARHAGRPTRYGRLTLAENSGPNEPPTAPAPSSARSGGGRRRRC